MLVVHRQVLNRDSLQNFHCFSLFGDLIVLDILVLFSISEEDVECVARTRIFAQLLILLNHSRAIVQGSQLYFSGIKFPALLFPPPLIKIFTFRSFIINANICTV